jgi:hypothetical protein
MMQKPLKLIVCSILCTVIIVGCSSPERTPVNTPNQPSSTSVAVSPSVIPSATLVSSLTPSPVSLHTPITEGCLNILDTLPEGSKAAGYPILWGKALSPYAFLFNFETGKAEKIPAWRVKDFSAQSVTVSPDQTKIAYFDSGTGEATIKNNMLQDLNKINLPHEEDSYLSWLGNDNLLIVHSAWQDPKPQQAVILDALTGKQRAISSDYPDLFWKPDFSPDLPIIYNQQLTRALYPIQNGDTYTLALWDLQNNSFIAQHDNIRDFGRNPQWSPDGKQIAIVNDPKYSKGKTMLEYDLYSINSDGNSERLTSLLSSNPHGKYPSFFIPNFSWSPDGRYIAFWFTNSTGYLYQDFQLGVLDLQTKQVTNYCGLDVTDTNNREIASELKPVWSSDGSQLLVMTRLKKEQLSYNEMISSIDKDVKVFLVDLPSVSAAPLIENLYPVGWLK